MPQTPTHPEPPGKTPPDERRGTPFEVAFDCTLEEAFPFVIRRSLRLHDYDRPAAQDFAQDVMEKLITYSGPPYLNGRAAIHTIMANLFYDQMRKTNAKFRDLGREVRNDSLVNEASAQPSTVDRVIALSIRQRIDNARSAMTIKQRQVFDLSVNLDTGELKALNSTQISQIMGMPAATVRGHLAAALKVLRAALDDLR